MVHLLVSYDVTDDAMRARLARYLTGYLDRVQKSVFEGLVDDSKLEMLRMGIGQRIDRNADSVRIYTLCARCCRAVDILGSGKFVDEERGDVIV